MFATGAIVGLAEWIIDDTCLVLMGFGGKIISFMVYEQFNHYINPSFHSNSQGGRFLTKNANLILIHSANPQSRTGSDQYFHTRRPSVRHSPQNKTNFK